jgi:zinc protease
MRNDGPPVIRAAVILALWICTFLPGCAEKYAVRYKELKYPGLGDIVIPEIEQVTLSNGMRLYLMEDHEIPSIELWAMIRVGSIYEPADKVGLASITGTVLRTGGTARQTGDELDEELERIAASVETSIGLDSGYADMWVLKEDIDTGLRILADVLMNPAFSEDKIELAKIKHRSSIARRNDSSSSIAWREFRKLIYGPSSVYTRHAEYETIDSITRSDLVSFHKKYFCPNNVILGISGDFDTKDMAKKIKDTFSGWANADVDFPVLPTSGRDSWATVNLIPKEEVNQTYICIGHMGGLMSDPDYFSLVVTGQILSWRVFKNIGSREGLSYSVGANYSADYDHPGMFYLTCQTKSASTVRAIRAMIKEVTSLLGGQIDEEELAIAKESYLNSFVFNFESKSDLVWRLMTYAYFGYPSDLLQRTKNEIEKVSKEDIVRVAREHLCPEQMQILAVGCPTNFDESLSVFGTVREIDVTIPMRGR